MRASVRYFSMLVFAAAVCFGGPVQADILLELPPIVGTSTVPGFEGQIRLSSAQWGASNPNCGSGKGASVVTELVFTKETDRATVPMLNGVALNTVYGSAVVHFLDLNDQEYMKYDLQNPILQSTSTSSGGETPSESWSLSFSSAVITHIDVGGKGATQSMTFNVGPCP